MKTDTAAGLFAALGAIVGGGLGAVLVRQQKMADGIPVTLSGAAIGAAIGATLGARPAHAAHPVSVDIGPATDIETTSNGSILVVSPGIDEQTVSLDPNTPVVVYIPKGFRWVSLDGAGLTDATSPYQFTFLGPIDHTFVWVDSLNQQHTSTYHFVLNPQHTSETA